MLAISVCARFKLIHFCRTYVHCWSSCLLPVVCDWSKGKFLKSTAAACGHMPALWWATTKLYGATTCVPTPPLSPSHWSHWRVVEWHSTTLKKAFCIWCGFYDHRHPLIFNHSIALQFCSSDLPAFSIALAFSVWHSMGDRVWGLT